MNLRDIRDFHERINKVFHFSLALPIVPVGFIFLEYKHNNWIPPFAENTVINIVCLVSGILVATFVYIQYRNNLVHARDEPTLSGKFNQLYTIYRRFYLGSLLASVLLALGYYLTGSVYLIGGYLILLFALSLLRPYYERYNRDLYLDGETAKAVRRMSLSFDQE
jgi:hypothetical protein